MEAWKLGDAFGSAVAQMLFGDPSRPDACRSHSRPTSRRGRPHCRASSPARAIRRGAIDTAYFDEGLFVGYRFYDQHAQTPLFPFGHDRAYAYVSIASVDAQAT